MVVQKDKVGKKEGKKPGHIKPLLVVGASNKVPWHPRNHRPRGLKVLEEKTNPNCKGRLLGICRDVLADALSGEPGTRLSQLVEPPQFRDVLFIREREFVQVKEGDPTERETSEDDYVLQRETAFTPGPCKRVCINALT